MSYYNISFDDKIQSTSDISFLNNKLKSIYR